MVDHGARTKKQATAISTPNVAEVSIPYVVGLAPIHTADNPAEANVPVLVTSWSEAVEKLGFSNNWKTYTLCEFMFSHFQLYGCQPVVFCNALDAATMRKPVEASACAVMEHRVTLPSGAIRDSIVVKVDDGTFEIVNDVNAAVTERVGKKDGLTGCALDFSEESRKLAMTLTGPLSGVKNTGIFDTLAGLIEDGYTVTIEGKAITGLADFKATEAFAKLAALEEGGEPVTFEALIGSDGVSAAYTVVVTYPDPAAAQAEEDATEDAPAETALVQDEDYMVLYDSDSDACVVELLSGGSAYDAASLIVAYSEIAPEEVSVADIALCVGEVDACMNRVGLIPDLICAPGYSHLPVIAAIMATKAASINGLFGAKALIDIDCGENGARSYSDVLTVKAGGNIVDPAEIPCWPMMKLGDYQFHKSTQLAGLMAQVDTGNDNCPYESPSNKNFKMDGSCLEDGTPVNLTWAQANYLNGIGVVTALNFLPSGWVCWGNYTACYPGNTDVKDYFIPISRMFDFVGNTLIRTFWSKLDKSMNRRLRDTILDTCNVWLGGLVGSEYLLGARAEILESENPLTDLMAGIIRIHIYMTPPSPAQEIDFILEYDTSYVTAALAA